MQSWQWLHQPFYESIKLKFIPRMTYMVSQYKWELSDDFEIVF